MKRIAEGLAWLSVCFYVLILSYGELREINALSTVEIDELTGCEYVVSAKGGITPRIGTDYMQVGCRIDEGSDADAAP